MPCSHICQLPEPGCWFSSTVGDTKVPKATLLSVLVEAVLVLPAASCATPAGMLAITVPALLMPLTVGRAALGAPLTVAVLVAPAVQLSVTPALVKPLTGLLKTAVKLIGELLLGSAWPAAWSFVSEGNVASKRTLLSVLVEAVLRLPAASCATPAGMLAITVPALLMPLTATYRCSDRRSRSPSWCRPRYR